MTHIRVPSIAALGQAAKSDFVRLRRTPVPDGHTAIAQLTSPAFLIAAALLLLNDWVFKPAVGSWWTGKLSDVAGLFAFATFWTAFLPRDRRCVCALTAAGFLVWKSPASQPLLAAWNALGVWPLARVVDYTDWLALAALIPVRRAPRPVGGGSAVRHAPAIGRRIGAVLAGGIAVAAFTATSVRRSYPVPDATDHTVAAGPAAVRAALDSLGFRPQSSRREPSRNTADTISLYVRHPPERWIPIEIEVRETRPGESTMRIAERHGWSAGPVPTTDALDRAFRLQVVEPLREWLRRRSAPGG
jgi:hypothetical protein